MNLVKIVLIALAIILIFIIIKAIKPYTIKYDTVLSLFGGNGSGKTLTGVKITNNLIARATTAWFFANFKDILKNKRIERQNKKIKKWNKEHPTERKRYIKPIDIEAKPQVYSTIPVYYKRYFWSKREYSCKFQLSHALLLEPLAQHSIVLLDELPQFVNQYNWDIPEVQNQFAEFATLFRHYYDGHIIITSQAIQEIVAQIRRKENIGTWCFNFRKMIWPLSHWFYKMSCCDIMTNDSVSVTASTLVDENTKTYYGKFPRKDTYNSRCYSERIKNTYYGLDKNPIRFDSLKTNEIIRFETDKISPLDDTTTTEQKEKMAKKFKLPIIKPKITTNILQEIIEAEKKEAKKWKKGE